MSMTSLRSILATLPAVALATACLATVGCAAGPHAAMAPESAPAMAAPAPPPVLAKSLFSKDASGSLTEGDLQKVLESPIDLQFPGRVGVVPVARPFDSQGKVALGT